jgi:hypothetical protein
MFRFLLKLPNGQPEPAMLVTAIPTGPSVT